jgi:hypothetical protein
MRRGPILLPVVVRRPPAAPEVLPVEVLVRDVVIRVASGSDVGYIAALVDALRS